MNQVSGNAPRLDPYKDFRFRLKWEGRVVAGVSKISRFRRTTEVVDRREASAPSVGYTSPGRTRFDPITLERGVTYDTEFERWTNKVWNLGGGLHTEVSIKDFRKDLTLEVHDQAGQVVAAYRLYRCWPSAFEALPDLDAPADAVAFESLTLENEGWERSGARAAPEARSFSEFAEEA